MLIHTAVLQLRAASATRACVHSSRLLQTEWTGSFHHLRVPGVCEPRLNFHLELEGPGSSRLRRPRWGVRPRKHARAPARTPSTHGADPGRRAQRRPALCPLHTDDSGSVPNHSLLSQLVKSPANSLHRLWFPCTAEDRIGTALGEVHSHCPTGGSVLTAQAGPVAEPYPMP